MVHRIAQHVLQRRDHTLEQAPVELALCVVGVELHFLAELAGYLANDTSQTRQQTTERHHARAHEAFLQLGIDARLLQ